MSLFKKRKNLNIRQRRLDDEDELSEATNEKGIPLHDNSNDLNKVNSPQIKPQILGPTETFFGKKEKKKAKPKPEKKTTILSFEDELEADDGIVFQEKKSSLSYKLRKEMKKERKEKKKEERDKLRQIGSKDRKDKNSPMTISDLDDLGIRIVNGREAEVIAMAPGDSDESDEDKSKPTFRPRQKTEDSSLQPWKAVLQSGHIPDANLIHQIRKERQKARERGDFLPLDDTVKVEEAQGRFIREDDNDRSDDEGDRLKFSVNQDEIDRKQRREVFEAAQEDSDHDVEWEMQQLRKAGATKAKLSLENEKNNENCFDQSTPAASLGVTGTFSHPTPAEVAPSWGMAVADNIVPFSSAGLDRPVNYQAEGIIKRLRDSRESLNEVLRRHKVEADNVIDELVASKSLIARCTSDQDPLTETFKFYQDMRGYVTDLRECLNEKVAEIKRLEEQVYLIYRQKAQKMVQRRRQDVKDQNNEFSPFAGKMAKGDEYRVRRAAEREGRRTRRRRERERKGETNHHDGMSTDDEEATSQTQTMHSELESIAAESRRVFEDVEDEFSELRRVMRRFENWRSIDGPSYSDAYVSFNLPKIFSSYINLQLVLWNPLSKEGEAIEIEKMKWFSRLLLYGHRDEDISLSKFKEDPDRRLLSNIVEKVILHKLKDLVSCYWDPLSHVQSVRLVNLIRHYTSTYPSITPNSKHMKDLMTAIIAKIKDSIENDVFIPMFPKSVYESKTSGVSLFFQRQFWSSWKLLGSALMWHRILSDSIIHDLAIRSLLNLYLLPALNLAAEINISDSLEKTRHVINVLPREWSKNEGGTHAFLGRLEAFLVTLAGKLDPTGNSTELKEICELLKAIGARSQSEILSNKYL